MSTWCIMYTAISKSFNMVGMQSSIFCSGYTKKHRKKSDRR